MVVSLTPSVSDQPAAHFVRSTVQPSGPVSVFPSADFPQWLSLIRLTMAARCCVHSASHSAIDVGCGPAVVDEAPVVVVAPPAEVLDAAVVVGAALEFFESSPPQPAANSAKASPPATRAPVRVRCTFPPIRWFRRCSVGSPPPPAGALQTL